MVTGDTQDVLPSWFNILLEIATVSSGVSGFVGSWRDTVPMELVEPPDLVVQQTKLTSLKDDCSQLSK